MTQPVTIIARARAGSPAGGTRWPTAYYVWVHLWVRIHDTIPLKPHWTRFGIAIRCKLSDI